ncbi:uncharacterized protein LOC143279852 [Babylonia areolata]|uniref:uncharacterized protein LOC143279852 n=1 Tax=Babylonia areolata TaxID=304850 RepID=UPI003FD57850
MNRVELEENRMAEETSGAIIPYMCLFIDAGFKDLSSAALQCVRTNHDRNQLTQELQDMWTTTSNHNPVLPLLSVRSGLDLFFKVMDFPPGSEIIMSAMNIPDVVRIVKHHKLRIVPLDISIDTAAPKVELLSQLVSPRTVAIIIAHLFGKWSPMDEVIEFAKKRNLYVVEDCAEAFCGFDQLSHPETDLALFSFGVIKFYTSFGGAIAKVKPQLYRKMVTLQDTYRIQSQAEYLKKVLKYMTMYFALNSPTFIKNGIQILQLLGINDYKDKAVKLLRGFPNNMMAKIRERPCTALLATMLKRQQSFSPADFYLQRLKGEYMAARLPPSMEVVGTKASINNYWLFPVVVENPDNLMYLLNALGVDAYRGATQLNIVEPANGSPDPLINVQSDNSPQKGEDCDVEEVCEGGDHVPAVNRQYPHEAKYLVDHVLYLPVHKLVPFHILNHMLSAIRTAVALDRSSGEEKVKVFFPSKL